MSRLKFITFMAAIMLVSASCGDETFRYSGYHCNLTIDNSKHIDPTLNSAMNPMAKGTFCLVAYKNSGGAKVFTFRNNFGTVSESVFNAIDDRMESHLHLGMNNGVIVGYGNMSEPAEFFAYDKECPNCFNPNAIPLKSYPLGMTSDGMATCNNCKRRYNMNTGGNVTNNSGRRLNTYRAATSGSNGVLHVY